MPVHQELATEGTSNSSAAANEGHNTARPFPKSPRVFFRSSALPAGTSFDSEIFRKEI